MNVGHNKMEGIKLCHVTLMHTVLDGGWGGHLKAFMLLIFKVS